MLQRGTGANMKEDNKMGINQALMIAEAILMQAEKDLRKAVRERDERRIFEIRRFYLSDWGQIITLNNGEHLFNRLIADMRQNGTSSRKRFRIDKTAKR